MPSYRITLTIGALRGDTAPSEVLPLLGEVARAEAVVESERVDIVRGEPRAIIRFTGDDDTHAEQVAGRVLARGRALAEVKWAVLTRRDGSRWPRVSGFA